MKTITIDARIDGHKDFRPFCVRGAVAAFADKIEVGERVIVSSVIDDFGNCVDLQKFRMNLSGIKENRTFTTRAIVGGLCIVTRLS